MSNTIYKVGDEVAVIDSRGHPTRITKITKVRTRLGEITSYETADGGKFNPWGYWKGDGYYRPHIEMATDQHRHTLQIKRHAYALERMREEDWAKLPLETLVEITSLAGLEPKLAP